MPHTPYFFITAPSMGYRDTDTDPPQLMVTARASSSVHYW